MFVIKGKIYQSPLLAVRSETATEAAAAAAAGEQKH